MGSGWSNCRPHGGSGPAARATAAATIQPCGRGWREEPGLSLAPQVGEGGFTQPQEGRRDVTWPHRGEMGLDPALWYSLAPLHGLVPRRKRGCGLGPTQAPGEKGAWPGLVGEKGMWPSPVGKGEAGPGLWGGRRAVAALMTTTPLHQNFQTPQGSLAGQKCWFRRLHSVHPRSYTLIFSLQSVTLRICLLLALA